MLTNRNGKKTLINLNNVTKIVTEIDTMFYFIDGTSVAVKEDFAKVRESCFNVCEEFVHFSEDEALS
jgi:uncharacterized protein YlzI (FlbEa/FlbD family)